MTQFWLWVGVIGMTLGAIFFGIGAHNAKNQRWMTLFILNFFITAIAAALYLTMALGQGVSEVNGLPTYWVRYVTWFLSTPLLLLDLTFLGRTNRNITGSLLGANAYMIATGFVATISRRPVNFIWYIVSCGAFLAVLYLLVKPYRDQAEQNYPRAKKAFRKLLGVHVILWTLYPVVWILGGSGLRLISPGLETAGFTILDLASKVGFGLLSLNTMHTLERVGETASEPQPA